MQSLDASARGTRFLPSSNADLLSASLRPGCRTNPRRKWSVAVVSFVDGAIGIAVTTHESNVPET
jgi:hypothetical protein